MSSNFSLTRFWFSLGTIGILIFLLSIEYTAVNLALVPISKDITADLNLLQWLLSSYILIWAALVVPSGRLADIYGKVRMLLIGLTVFLAGSAISGLGNSISILILGRIIQGIGAAFFSAPAYGIIFGAAPASMQGTAMGVIAAISGLGLALGPTLAGFIIEILNWRWIFFINIPLGIIVYVAAIYLLPKDEHTPHQVTLNYGVASLLVLGLGTLVFGINQIEVWGFKSIHLWFTLGAAIILLTLFYFLDQQSIHQTIPKSLLKNKGFVGSIGAIFGLAYNFSMFLFMISLYLQSTLHMSAYKAGIFMLWFSLVYGLLSPLGGRIADRFDIRVPCAGGTICFIISLFLLSFAGTDSSLVYLAISLFMAGIGLALVFPSINTAMFKTIDPRDMNTGSAIFTMLMMLGNSIGVVISSSLLVLWGEQKLQTLLTKANLTLTDDQYKAVLSVINQAQHTKEQLNCCEESQIPILLQIIDESFVSGMSKNMWLGMVLCFMSLALIIFRLKSQYLHKLPTTTTMPVH